MIVLLGMLVIAGPASAQVSPDKLATAAVLPQTEADCDAAGGRWGGTEHGRGRIPGCNLPTRDAGKSCDHSDQCEGACVERGGNPPICSDHQKVKGCGIRMLQPAELFEVEHEVSIMCVD